MKYLGKNHRSTMTDYQNVTTKCECQSIDYPYMMQSDSEPEHLPIIQTYCRKGFTRPIMQHRKLPHCETRFSGMHHITLFHNFLLNKGIRIVRCQINAFIWQRNSLVDQSSPSCFKVYWFHRLQNNNSLYTYRYNKARPPNNMRKCSENPPQMEYLYQIWLAKNY